jgi:chromosome partitioning protein
LLNCLKAAYRVVVFSCQIRVINRQQNRADPRGQDNNEAADIIRDTEELSFIETPLGSRKAFCNAAAQGLAVTELKQQDAKAIDEIMILFRYVFEINKES